MLDRSECIRLLNSAFDLPTSPLGIHKYREGHIIDEEKISKVEQRGSPKEK